VEPGTELRPVLADAATMARLNRDLFTEAHGIHEERFDARKKQVLTG
jgi:hypothetical protein